MISNLLSFLFASFNLITCHKCARFSKADIAARHFYVFFYSNPLNDTQFLFICYEAQFQNGIASVVMTHYFYGIAFICVAG